MTHRRYVCYPKCQGPSAVISWMLVSVVLGTFSEHRLAQALGEGNKAKLCADALPAVRHFGDGLGLQRSLLELAHVCEPFVQRMLDFFREHCLELRQIAGFHRMFRSRNHWPIVDASGL